MPASIGSSAAILGPVILLIATMLHPMHADPADPLAAFTEYAADRIWIATHLAQFAGIATIYVSFHALAAQLRRARDNWSADLALGFATAAIAVAAILQAVDGIALKAMVDHWAAVPDAQKQVAFQAALAVRQIETGVASFVAMLLGMAVATFGAAIVNAPPLPKWLGWFGVAAGAGAAAAGLLMAFRGFSASAMNVGMPFFFLALFWIGLAGVEIWRRRFLALAQH